jgi:ectoine hydroxylase-related dioxygenase (phytanoyl-CoA dioxygenase family)
MNSTGGHVSSHDDRADEVDAHLADIRDRGYTVVPGVLSPEEADAYASDLARIEVGEDIEPASNEFEGTRTLRVYNLLRHGEMWQRIPVADRVLPIVDAVLGPGCLISSLSSIRIQPGETAQPIHSDDQVLPVALPEPPVVCNTMWALTDFTEANVWHGRLWHGGGANTTDADRIGIAMNYCAGWIRQQENQQLGLPVELVRTFEPRLRELVGYGTYMGLVGHIEKQTADQLLCGDSGDTMVWDLT